MARILSEETKKKNRIRAKKWSKVPENHTKQKLYHEKYGHRYVDKQKALRVKHKHKLNQICSVPCFDCGKSFPPECMDFDHLPQYKKRFDLSKAGGRCWNTVLDEILKCDIVCACCHRTRTKNRK